MAAAVPTFSGGMKENGWDWLKEIKAHFADARMSTDAARCEYFELKLRADAARRFEELPEATRTDWKLLETEWKQMYPSRNTYFNNAKDIDEFYDLRITDSDLAKRNGENNEGDAEWAIAQFLERLRYLGTKVKDTSETSKGRHAFRHLPPLLRDRLPTYGTQGPALENLCADLTTLDHAYIAKLATQQERIQSQLDSISRFPTQISARPQRVGPQPRQFAPNAFTNTTTNAFNPPFTASAVFSQTDSQTRANRALRPIANNIAHAADASKNINPVANKNFDTNPDGIRQYEDAVNRWFATYGTDAIPNASCPFPLTPGSPSPGSGECWRCGHKGHYKESAECLRNNPLPDKEQQYRRIVGASILNAVRNIRTTAAFHIESGTFDEFDRNYAFTPDEAHYEEYQKADPFSGNDLGDGL
ncbi:hypothetical protein M422DRAFT_259269 [Sphaerobolus stellatus SS14]|uniref:CCHC-type domain-containing protein n=1 Tax=Sphaerobolus stellatus (strain SS14) TaxID=990650 RepID=A0A0C9V989_SPHS4|nr:hypothetical protein M422DRAFT_259269 [Sphaerobolus stellatus SS14]